MSGSKGWRRIVGLAVVVALVMVLSSSVAAAGLGAASTGGLPSGYHVTVSAPSNPTANPGSSPSSPTSVSPPVSTPGPAGTVLGINKVLAAAVNAKEKALVAAGGNLSNFHPPNLHQAPPLKATQEVVTPLYSVAPAPLGVAYYGFNNTTGTIQATVANTTSLAGSWSTTDPLGTAAELFDTSSGNAAGSFGAQLNSVLVNVTLAGQTSSPPNVSSGNDPGGCPTTATYLGLPHNNCPNEFWLQNYIQYTESSHTLTVSNEIWNFSNPGVNFFSGSSTLTGFGSVEQDEVYQGPSSGTITIPAPYTFSLVLYLNYTQGPCHTDTTPGTGIGSCPAAYGTTYPLNELFMNYTVRSSTGARLCPTSTPTGRVCGEDDDVFFNSLAPGATSGVPLYGPNHRIGSATIQANGTGYDPVGLTNDWEFDYAIGSDDGATNNIVYQDGVVGLGYCTNANATQSVAGGISCGSGLYGTYSPTPAAMDFGGETGETSTGEMAYWAPQGTPGLGPTFQAGSATPVTHLDTGPSLLVGLWNMTGSTYTGHAPYPAYEGGEPLSYQNIAPANAWLGIAQDRSPGVTVTSQYYFQVAPTFGFFSYWKGSGGDLCASGGSLGCSGAGGITALGSSLYLPSGWYTIEVLLSGYEPVVMQIDLTDPQAPDIKLVPNYSTGAYTPDWAFSNSDLANLSVSPSNTVPTGSGTSGSPYLISAPAPDVGTVTSISGGQVVIGQTGSLSWLFSNLNDYDFTVWIGGFINSTTAVTQFNPAPSFPMVYPTWQYGGLDNGVWDLPITDGFQYYLLNTQNLAVIGASDLYAWANSEATSIYEVVVNNGANDLIANDHFNITNRGLDITGGGTTDVATINGASVPFQYDSHTRNVVWGNTFAPAPLGAPYSLAEEPPEPFTAQDSLVFGEAFDRVYNNVFAATSPTVNASVAATSASDTTYWNVTCISGYAPLSQETYPGSGPTGVCEPLTYAKSLDGYTLSGSIVGSSYQGGNFWASYGNEPNPYANIPFKNRLTSLTGTAEIGSATSPYFGDMAPLINYHVSELTFKETGLPSSSTTTEFTLRVTNATSHYTWLNTSATNVNPASCGGGTYVCVNFYVPFGTYTWLATPPSGYGASPATGSVVFSTPSTVVSVSFATGYTVTFTETGLPASTRWYVNTTGQVSLTGITTTLTQTLPSGSYTFSAATVNALYAWSSSPGFTVSGANLAVGVTFSIPAISVSPTQGPVGATVTVSGTGFTALTALSSLVFDSVSISSCSSGSLTTNGSGSFSCTFAVPSGTLGTTVTATNSGGQTATGTFTVTAAAITVTPGQGPVGASVTVAGTGFSVSTPLASLVFDGVSISTCASGSLTTGGTGAFSCTFSVPSGPAGTTVTATDSGGQTASGAFIVTTPTITVSPSQGPVGATVTVSGTGFSESSTVGLVFDGVTISSCTSGSLTTSGTGAFSCTFSVPSGTSGTTVTATDVGGETAIATFAVTTPTIAANPSQGPVGATVTVSGTGFSAMTTVGLVFDGVTVSTCTSGSLGTDGSGDFSCTFAVPGGTSGSAVTATDVGGQTATATFTVTTPTLAVTPGQGPVGASVTVSGTGFSVSSTVGLLFDGVSVSSCGAGSLGTDGSGDFACTFPVPSGTSGTTVTATDVGGQTASGSFLVTVLGISVDPSQGPAGASVTVSGAGFSVSSTVGLVFDGVTVSSCTSGSLMTDGSGDFSCTLAVPSGTSGTSVEATDAGGQTTSATFTVTTPAITVTPGQGPVGATVTVSGTGFSLSSPVGLDFDGVTVSSCSGGSLTTDPSGAFSCTFSVPTGTSGTLVTATDIGGATATGTFTVTTPALTVTPGQGPVGATVTVSGTGFSVSSTVGLVFDGLTVSSCGSGALATDSSGDFSCTIAVPSGTSGTTVTATDVGAATASATFVVTTPALTVTPAKGPVGAVVTVSGTGFSVSSTVGLQFDGVAISSCTSGSLSTGATGTFSCTFAVPSGASGTTVRATDVGGQTATGSFSVTTPAITVTPQHGPVGASVTVSGTGFSVSTPLKSLVFDNVVISSCTSGSLTTTPAGTFSCTFAVPSGTSGTTVTATDVGGQYASKSFTLTTPNLALSPSKGPVGATVTATGTGFSASSRVGLVFDGVTISSCTSGSLTTNAGGSFTCTFAVPSGTSGTTVRATDVGGQTATKSFSVTTPAISLTSKQGPIGATVTVSGSGFSVSSTVGLVFDGVTISSCTSGSLTTTTGGSFSCTFTVPSGTSGTTVTATDVGGQSASRTFTVTTPAISVTPGKGPIGATVTVSGSGFSVSSTVGLVFDGVTISSCKSGSLTTSTGGSFSCTFTVPSGTSGTTVTATDVGGQSASKTFTVTTPAISVAPKQGPIGASVTVSGSGFSQSSTVGLVFDGVTVSSCTSGSLTTNTGGSFSCTFAVPSGTSGTTVTATDVGGQTATGKFTVTTPAISVSPKQGPVGTTVTVSGTGFSVSSVVSLVFDGVTITSCNVGGGLTSSASGSFSCTFTVPSGTSGTTVTATDVGGQSAVAKFTVT
jgi:hypothetical protein